MALLELGGVVGTRLQVTIIVLLTEESTEGVVRGVSDKDERLGGVWVTEDWSRSKLLLEILEGLDLGSSPFPRLVLGEEFGERES